MQILDALAEAEDARFRIPFYHRGHLSLKSDTVVTVCMIPPSPQAGSARMMELIVSSVDFKSWGHLWRITGVFREQQGVVQKLLSIVADIDLNILFEESSSVQNRALHAVDLVVDASSSSKLSDDDEFERMLWVERRLKALLIDDVALDRGRARIRVRRMQGLRNAWQKYNSSRLGASTPKPRYERAKVERGYLTVPESIADTLPGKPRTRYLRVSDTEERLLRIFCVPEDQDLTYVRVAHLDSVGALSAITHELARAFDIFTSLTRIQDQGSLNHAEFLLYSKGFPGALEEEKRRRIIETLLSGDQLTSYDVRIAYPSSVGEAEWGDEAPPEKADVVFDEAIELPEVSPGLFGLSTAQVVEQEIARYNQNRQKAADYPTDRDLAARATILEEISRAEGVVHPIPQIFVSFPFGKEDLLKQVVAYLEEKKCAVQTGKKPTEGKPFRNAIRRRIKNSHGFLGIWSALPEEGFSTWLPWELGVAETVRLPHQLLIDHRVPENYWKKLYPEQHHTVFTESEFHLRLREAIDQLIEDVRQVSFSA